jgi:hypothetical protein
VGTGDAQSTLGDTHRVHLAAVDPGERPSVSEGRTIMSQCSGAEGTFVDRRNYDAVVDTPEGRERRQFSNSHDGLSPEARELAMAIDEYKVRHRRRFITYEEMLAVVKNLGYHKQ